MSTQDSLNDGVSDAIVDIFPVSTADEELVLNGE